MSLRISASFLEISSVSFVVAAVPPSSSPSTLSSSPFFNFVHVVADTLHDRTCLNDHVWELSVVTVELDAISFHF